jgi:signal transduction histidine kinase
MNSPEGSAVATPVPYGRPGWWAAALTGLTPAVVAGVAVLVLIRSISTSLDEVVIAAEHHDLAGWVVRVLGSYTRSLVMAVPMLVGIFATANLGPQRGIRRVAALTAAVVLSTLIGTLLRIAVADAVGLAWGWGRVGTYLTYVWPRYIVLGGMLTAVLEFYRRELRSLRDLQEAELDSARFEREMVAARLLVLQAQIEPHFLFNTLANVRRLCSTDPAAGRAMLESLMRYLEVALPRMRDAESTLGRDGDLIDAFLRVQRIRMGRRLAYSLDIPQPLRALPVPPMMLLTLVENALRHGIGPVLDGGTIRVAAHQDDGELTLTVADTGLGFSPGSGSGTGLANIRARLAAQFGERGRLVLGNNEFGGATATIVLPVRDAVGST